MMQHVRLEKIALSFYAKLKYIVTATYLTRTVNCSHVIYFKVYKHWIVNHIHDRENWFVFNYAHVEIRYVLKSKLYPT